MTLPRSVRRFGARTFLMSAIMLLALGPGHAAAQDELWTLQVCAQPNNLPFSARPDESGGSSDGPGTKGAGLENQIAEILADELDASLAYEWLPEVGDRTRELAFRRGECDVVMGVADGTTGYLTTLAYYRSLPVFVFPAAGPDIASFDDPVLADLTIAVLGGAGVRPETMALMNRGLAENQVAYSFDVDRPSPLAVPVEAVAAGDADVAVVWGPIGGYFAPRQDADLEVVPVSPKVDLPFLNMVTPIAMGVRPGDTSLRDLLNEALVRRWADVQAVLEEYGVPREPLPQPSPATEPDEARRVGLVLPLPTGGTPLEIDHPFEATLAAERGALLAAESTHAPNAVKVLTANAPSAEAARRAALRLAYAQDVFAIVGGFGEDQVAHLRAAATGAGVPFVNAGRIPSPAPSACSALAFATVPAPNAYLSALADAHGASAGDRWAIVHADDATGHALAGVAIAVLDARGAAAFTLPVENPLDPSVQAAIADEGPEVVLLLLDWREQLDFLGLATAMGLAAPVTGFPHPSTQTRAFYDAVRNLGAPAASARIAAWDPAAPSEDAQQLARRYAERWGAVMDAPAWAAFAAVDILGRAVAALGSADPADVIVWLEQASGPPPGVSGTDGGSSLFVQHRLRSPLYVVAPDPAAPPVGSPDETTRIARVLDRIAPPAETAGAGGCRTD